MGNLIKWIRLRSIALCQLQIAQYNPDIVVYPDIRDDNPDHSAIGKMMEKILKADPNEITGYAYLCIINSFGRGQSIGSET